MLVTICWNRLMTFWRSASISGVSFGLGVRDPLDAGAQERVLGGIAARADAGDAFAKQQEVVLGHADGFVHHADGADLVHVLGARSVDARVELGDYGERAVFAERLHEGDGTGASYGDGEQGTGKDDRIADGEHGDFLDLGEDGFGMGSASASGSGGASCSSSMP